MVKHDYWILAIVLVFVIIAVAFMYYSGGAVGEAKFSAKKQATEDVRCINRDPNAVVKCEGGKKSCEGKESCILKDITYAHGTEIDVRSPCDPNTVHRIRIDGKMNDGVIFNCPAVVEFKEYAVGDTFDLNANEAIDISFKGTRTSVNLFFKYPESSLYVNGYSPGYMSEGFVYHIPVDNILVVLRLKEVIFVKGIYQLKFIVESIGKPSKSSAWPSLPEPAETIAISNYRPSPDTVKVPVESVVALKCDRLCFIYGLFDVQTGYEVRALNEGVTGKVLARTGENKFKVFDWGKYGDAEIFVVKGLMPQSNQSNGSG
jgi:hypothetical protein